jgi:uncharacterized protein
MSNRPDFGRASQYALERLGRELSPALLYHSLVHTRDNVAAAVERLAAMEGVEGEGLLLLRTAALYHDIGFIERYDDNEVVGVQVAAETLPRFGYSLAQVQVISGIIMATKMPQSPRTLLEEIMADADLGVLGREDFFTRNRLLRAEMASFGRPSSDEEWYSDQLKFMQEHRYFTAAGRAMYGTNKRRNIEGLIKLLEGVKSGQ